MTTASPTIAPAITAWIERFRTGAAQAYRGQWFLTLGHSIRVLLSSPGPGSKHFSCCPLTAHWTVETAAAQPLGEDRFYEPRVRDVAQLTEAEINQVVAAADSAGITNGALLRPLTPEEQTIRTALLAACGLGEGSNDGHA